MTLMAQVPTSQEALRLVALLEVVQELPLALPEVVQEPHPQLPL